MNGVVICWCGDIVRYWIYVLILNYWLRVGWWIECIYYGVFFGDVGLGCFLKFFWGVEIFGIFKVIESVGWSYVIGYIDEW